jgi:HD-GYP domain-containing protein (c-di-GMP phosphodiesterase class II)
MESIPLATAVRFRRARTHEFAIDELKRCAGTQFDPEVVRVFLETPIGGEILT